MAAEVLTGVLAFTGAGIGSTLGYVATRGAAKAERAARRREEWGRRFTIALEAYLSSDVGRRATGRTYLVESSSAEPGRNQR